MQVSNLFFENRQYQREDELFAILCIVLFKNSAHSFLYFLMFYFILRLTLYKCVFFLSIQWSCELQTGLVPPARVKRFSGENFTFRRSFRSIFLGVIVHFILFCISILIFPVFFFKRLLGFFLAGSTQVQLLIYLRFFLRCVTLGKLLKVKKKMLLRVILFCVQPKRRSLSIAIHFIAK